MSVQDAIREAKRCLELKPVESDLDPRWQSIIKVSEFIESHPEPVWMFILESSASDDDDLHSALATCLLEHFLDQHPRYRSVAQYTASENQNMAAMLAMCW